MTYLWCPLATVLLSLSTINGQLRSNDEDISDGPCPSSFPESDTHKLQFVKSFPNMFIFPLTSKVLSRFQYEFAHGKSAQTEEEIASMRPRGKVTHLDNGSAYQDKVSRDHYEKLIFENPSASYELKCTPTELNMGDTNRTCIIVDSSRKVGFGRTAVVTVLWHDDLIWLEWLCIEKRQMFRVLAHEGHHDLTPLQLKKITEILTRLGFQEKHFQRRNY